MTTTRTSGYCLFSYSYPVSITSSITNTSITNTSWAGIQASSPAMIPQPEPSVALLAATAAAAFAIRRAGTS